MHHGLCIVALMFAASAASAQTHSQDTRPNAAPDLREEKVPLKIQDGNLLAVPIPTSGPTLGTGLVAGSAYFYPQTEERKKVEPASVTGIAAMYTTSDSKAIALFHQGYWGQDRWRLAAGAALADFNVNIIQPDEDSGSESVDYNIAGTILGLRLSRKLRGDWYAGVFTRSIFARQNLVSDVTNSGFDIGDVRAVGVGLSAEYDGRDLPINSFAGRHFTLQGLINDKSLGSQQDYQSYSAKLRSYHLLRDGLVFAWELQGCSKSGTIPLWDACRIPLRGFSAFDYLGDRTLAGQGALRWQASKRWGLVGFAGAGRVDGTFSGFSEGETIPSYGAGIRFMVLPEKRINVRLDFAKSDNDSAIHLGVGEAF